MAINEGFPELVNGRLPVDGSGVTQPVSGTVTITPSGTQNVNVTNASIAVTGPLTDAELRAAAVPISGTVTANAGTGTFTTTVSNASGASAVNIQDGGNSLTVDATNLDIRDLAFATDKIDVSNSVIALDSATLTALENTSVTVTNASGASAVNIQDGGNSITVDGTVAISGSVAVTGPLTDSQLRATPVPVSGTVTASNPSVSATGAAVPASATMVGGSDGTDLRAIKVSATGVVSVDGSAVTQPVSGTVTANAGTNLNTSALNLETTQSAINTKIPSGLTVTSTRLLTDGSGVTQPVSAASLPLPTGAATAANQLPDGHNVTVDNAAGAAAVNIQDGGNSITVDGTVAATQSGTWNITNISGTVSLPTGAATAALQTQPGVDIGDVTINNASGASAVNIQDGGNSITVDGSVSITGTSSVNLAQVNGNTVNAGSGAAGTGTQRVILATDQSVIPVSDNGGSLTVDGTVAATQSGTWNITNVSGTVSLPTGAATLAEQQTQTASLSVLDDWDETDRAKVNIIVGQAGVAAGAGTTGVTTQRVVIATDQTVIPISDNSGSLTVDNAGTFAVQAAQSGTWTVQPGNTANTTPWLTTISQGGFTATVRDLASNDALNVAIVDGSGNQITSFGGGTEYTEDVAAAADPIGKATILIRKDTPATITSADGDNVAQRGTNYGAAYVQVVNSTGSFVDTFGGGTQYTEDVPAAADPTGTMGIAVRADTLAAVTSADGDNIAYRATNKGELYVKHVDTIPVTDNGGSLTVDGSLTTVSTVTSLTQLNGAAISMNTGVRDAGTQRVTIATNDVVPVSDNGGSLTIDGTVTIVSSNGTLTDRSGTATTTSAQIAASNSSRKYFYIQNNSGGIIWFNFNTTAVASQPSIRLASNESREYSGTFIPTEAINVISGGGNRTFTAKEG